MARKPLDLGDLVQPPGQAEQPSEPAPRTSAPPSTVEAPTSPTTPSAQHLPGRKPRSVSMTLRLAEDDYERLRRHAFDSRLSHQALLETALMEYLDKHALK